MALTWKGRGERETEKGGRKGVREIDKKRREGREGGLLRVEREERGNYK
jgi:hypothetical protein